ncbi:hypothetical protein ACS0TY_021416 [Phlomoides rotata]
MSATATKLIIATSVGAVEALKDQGFCRWNHVIRNSMIRSFSQAKNSLSSSLHDDSSASAIVPSSDGRVSEESLRKVMLLSSWVPN